MTNLKIFFLVTVLEKNRSPLGDKKEIWSYMHSESDLICKFCLSYDKIPYKDMACCISNCLMNVVLKNQQVINVVTL
jgi:hypothetical protein